MIKIEEQNSENINNVKSNEEQLKELLEELKGYREEKRELLEKLDKINEEIQAKENTKEEGKEK